MQHTQIENHLSEEGYSCLYIKGKDQLSGVYASMPRLGETFTVAKQEQKP